MNKKQLAFFVFVFAILLAGRLCIAGTGYLEDPDEFLYIWIHMHFAAFTHLHTWTDCMNRMQGQPPEIATRLLEYITLTPIASAMGKPMLSADVLYFMGLYNILVSLLTVYVFYNILLKIGFSVELAIAGMLLLGTLFNFNMYTRHILPYDQALLFQLMSLNLLLSTKLKPGTILLAGLLSAIGLTNYMGCFMFVFINGGFVVIANYNNLKLAIKNALLFVLPFVALVAFYQAVTLYEGHAYLTFLKDYYGTIAGEGSTDEGLHFIFLYFYLVEKWWGMLLLLLFFWGSYLIIKRSGSAKTKQLILLGAVAYITFGAYVFFFQSMVFEGRVLHIYYPFIIIGVLGWLQQQKLIQFNKLVTIIVVFACVNYGFVVRDFNRIGYPRNTIYKCNLFEEKGKVDFSYYEEISPALHYYNRARYFIDTIGPRTLPAGHYVLSNICFMAAYPDSLLSNYKPWQKTEGDSIVFEQLHFESHPAYTLEYCSRFGRNFYIKNQIKIRVVRHKAL